MRLRRYAVCAEDFGTGGSYLDHVGLESSRIKSVAFRVSIVPGMVLPIAEVDERYPNPSPDRFVYVSRPGALRVVDLREQSDTHSGKAPSAAKPGMWAVQLKIASEGGGAVVEEPGSTRSTAEGDVSRNPTDPVPYDREVLVEVLVYHWRKSITGCGCGWSELGLSFPEHVADMYEASVRET